MNAVVCSATMQCGCKAGHSFQKHTLFSFYFVKCGPRSEAYFKLHLYILMWPTFYIMFAFLCTVDCF